MISYSAALDQSQRDVKTWRHQGDLSKWILARRCRRCNQARQIYPINCTLVTPLRFERIIHERVPLWARILSKCNIRWIFPSQAPRSATNTINQSLYKTKGSFSIYPSPAFSFSCATFFLLNAGHQPKCGLVLLSPFHNISSSNRGNSDLLIYSSSATHKACYRMRADDFEKEGRDP